MKSLGVIETQGLVTAIQATDAACKSAEVICIGYRKVGSGLVSVCFEGEISAIHTAIEHGVAVIGAGKHVNSLVIARPEQCVVTALCSLKGYPHPVKAIPKITSETKAEICEPMPPEESEDREPPAQTIAPEISAPPSPKSTGMKKRKKP